MHGWQDIILALGSLVLAAALIPSIMSAHKPALWTSGSTGLALAVFAVTYASLSLWYATVTTALSALLWGVLGVQKFMETNDKK
jgi:uncharacterized membrane protein